MRISDWSSDVCSSDLPDEFEQTFGSGACAVRIHDRQREFAEFADFLGRQIVEQRFLGRVVAEEGGVADAGCRGDVADRSEEHTSELQSLMRISYAVFCLKKKKKKSSDVLSEICTRQRN